MIERQVIEDLIRLMVEHDLVELDIADGDQSVTLRRAGATPVIGPAYLAGAATAASGSATTSTPAGATSTPAPGGDSTAAPPSTDTGTTINSPMVGTYYSKPNPDAESFATVGTKVSESSVVCLVEAMKVFNEIKAECRGTITEVLVGDGDAVDYGQPLFKIDPS
ncbi:MAG: acetyl-CoA carboxylase biotin carboxyl carrier protein [Planctomycetes bacterium]|nr:acetyl-CoA carboxylase biotin carboxyl carrier protein [Planctomycetota bacterium]NOG54466.1 acetyl-CoA carboxylase biotin carboxyl carrier protein [Planctomycetota bacterium]